MRALGCLHQNGLHYKYSLGPLDEMIRVQVTAAEAEDVNRLIRPQSFLLVVNEKSGKGQAKQIMEETSWILLASQVKGEILATTRAGHCFQFAKQLDRNFDAIVLYGGDGIVHEFVNGLMLNPRRDLLKCPIVAVPCGSGNALAAHIADLSGVKPTPHGLVYVAVKGSSKGLNLMELTLSQGRTLYSFLSIQYGMIERIDQGSQRLRFLGSLRFDVAGLYQVLFKRQLRSISLKTDTGHHYRGPVLTMLVLIIPYIRIGGCPGPLLKKYPMIDIQYVNEGGLIQTAKYFTSFEGGLINQDSEKPEEGYGLQSCMCYSFELELESDEIMIDGEKFKSRTVAGKLLQNVLQTRKLD